MGRELQPEQQVFAVRKVGKTGHSEKTFELNKFEIEAANGGELELKRVATPHFTMRADEESVFTRDEFRDVVTGAGLDVYPESLGPMTEDHLAIKALDQEIASRREEAAAA